MTEEIQMKKLNELLENMATKEKYFALRTIKIMTFFNKVNIPFIATVINFTRIKTYVAWKKRHRHTSKQSI